MYINIPNACVLCVCMECLLVCELKPAKLGHERVDQLDGVGAEAAVDQAARMEEHQRVGYLTIISRLLWRVFLHRHSFLRLCVFQREKQMLHLRTENFSLRLRSRSRSLSLSLSDQFNTHFKSEH